MFPSVQDLTPKEGLPKITAWRPGTFSKIWRNKVSKRLRAGSTPETTATKRYGTQLSAAAPSAGETGIKSNRDNAPTNRTGTGDFLTCESEPAYPGKSGISGTQTSSKCFITEACQNIPSCSNDESSGGNAIRRWWVMYTDFALRL